VSCLAEQKKSPNNELMMSSQNGQGLVQ